MAAKLNYLILLIFFWGTGMRRRAIRAE